MTNAGRVTFEHDVVFGIGGGRDLKLDIYVPPAGMSNRGGVLLIHGGGWSGGDRTQLRGFGILLGRVGFTCVSTEYRLSGEAKWPAQIHDVKAALRWMRASSARLGIDADKIAVSGNSAGGHLSLMVAATADMPEFEGSGGAPGVSTAVAACVAVIPAHGADQAARGRRRGWRGKRPHGPERRRSRLQRRQPPDLRPS